MYSVNQPATTSRTHTRNRKTPTWLLLSLLGSILFAQPASAGKLSATHDVISDENDDDIEDDDKIQICLFCFLGNEDDDGATYETDTGPGTDIRSAFLRHPYADGAEGYSIVRKRNYEMVADPETNTYSKQVSKETTTPGNLTVNDGKSIAFTGTGAYKYNWDGIHLSDIRFGIDSADMVGLQLRWTEFYEPTNGDLDTLELFDLMIRIPLINEHRGQFHIGLAGLLMHYDSDTRAGATLCGQVRLFPVQPLVLGADLLIGYIDSAAYIRAETTIGAIVGPLEAFVGYETQLFLGKHRSIIYHGPGAGIRIWF